MLTVDGRKSVVTDAAADFGVFYRCASNSDPGDWFCHWRGMYCNRQLRESVWCYDARKPREKHGRTRSSSVSEQL